jgi:tuftelin-interacting protein 11
MMPLYAPIRHKLSSALGAWHPGDGSALALLAPWRRVFADSDWESLLARCILPKLGWALSQLVVNPADQQLEPLQWALAWAEAVPARHMATLLEQVRSTAGAALAHISPVLIRPSPCRPQSFFPKWHAVLHAWLSAAPNFDEVTRWYLGWKGLFPEEARAPHLHASTPHVRDGCAPAALATANTHAAWRRCCHTSACGAASTRPWT